MKRAVVDASVAVKWVVEETHSAEASLLLQCDARHAPDHWRAQAANALWSKVFTGELPATDAEERVALLQRAPVIDEPIAGLISRAFAISVALSLTIYDSLYVALAERLDTPLVTADQGLIRRLAGHARGGVRAIWVGDLQSSVV